MKAKYDQYVHEYIDAQGRTRYAVAEWNEAHAEYICPMDKTERELTGCFANFAKTPRGLGGYLSKRKALRRARYVFGQREIEE